MPEIEESPLIVAHVDDDDKLLTSIRRIWRGKVKPGEFTYEQFITFDEIIARIRDSSRETIALLVTDGSLSNGKTGADVIIEARTTGIRTIVYTGDNPGSYVYTKLIEAEIPETDVLGKPGAHNEVSPGGLLERIRKELVQYREGRLK